MRILHVLRMDFRSDSIEQELPLDVLGPLVYGIKSGHDSTYSAKK